MLLGFPLFSPDGYVCIVWARTQAPTGCTPQARWVIGNHEPAVRGTSEHERAAARGKRATFKQLFETGTAEGDFGKDVAQVLSRRRDLHFVVDYASDEVETAGLLAGIEGHHLCLDLLKDYRTPTTANRPMVLFATTPSNHGPAAIKDRERVVALAQIGLDNKYLLLLHPDDMRDVPEGPLRRMLPAEMKKKKRSLGAFAELRNVVVQSDMRANRMEREIQLANQGACYPFPVGQDWKEALIQFLGLIPLDEDQANCVPEECSEVTFSNLFDRVTPSLARTRSVNGFGEDSRLFNGSILHQAYLADDEVFSDSVRGAMPQRHLLVGGPTGVGKTTLALLAMLNEFSEKQKPVLYLGPTRMLVYEVRRQFLEFWKGLAATEMRPDFHLDPSDIVESTGEIWEHDWRIRHGDFRVAFIVYEKANLFLEGNTQLLQDLSLAVIDEIHMLSDQGRGGVLDILMAKLGMEAARRFHYGLEPLRILAATTEETSQDPVITDLLTLHRPWGNQPNRLPPIIINGNRRPLAVQHWIQPWMKGVSCPPTLISTIRSQKDRNLSENVSASGILDQIMVDSCPSDQSSRITYVREYIWNRCKVIVAGPHLDQLSKLALQLAEGRTPAPNIDDAWLQQFRIRVNDANITDQEAEFLYELATKGIFFHYANLGFAVRGIVEHAFRRFCASPEQPHILFATETLIYGVNLPADTIILTNIRWPRDDPVNMLFKHLPLTPNQYHNLLGRVGRFRHSNDAILQKAVVICKFKRKKPEDSRKRLEEILAMYGAFESCTPFVLLETKLYEFVRGKVRNLDDLPYGFFRFVYDALRHVYAQKLGEGCSIQDIIRLLKYSYRWCHLTQTEEQSRSKDEATADCYSTHLHDFVGNILEMSHDYFQETPLVEKKTQSNGTNLYRPTPFGSALVTTGSRPESLVTIGAWLRVLHRLTLEHGPLPVELICLGLLATPEFWFSYRGFTKESSIFKENQLPKFTRSQEVNQSKQLSSQALLGELKRILPAGDLAQKIMNEARTLMRTNEQDLPPNDEFPQELADCRESMYYRMAAAILRWLRGEEIGEINRLAQPLLIRSDPKGISSSAFNVRHAQKASMMVRMILRFYLAKDKKLLMDLGFSFAELYNRLISGIAPAGIPFTAGQAFSRKQILSLLDKDLDGWLLALNPTHFDHAEDPVHFGPEAEYLRLATHTSARFFINEGNRFLTSAASLCPPSAGLALKRMRILLQDTFSRTLSTPEGWRWWDAEDLLDEIAGQFSEFVGALLSREIRSESIRFMRIGSGDGFLLRITGPAETLERSPTEERLLAVRVPWTCSDITVHTEATLYGGVTLLLLAHFAGWSPSDIHGLLSAQGAVLLSVKDLLRIFFDVVENIPTELLESMLVLMEPMPAGQVQKIERHKIAAQFPVARAFG